MQNPIGPCTVQCTVMDDPASHEDESSRTDRVGRPSGAARHPQRDLQRFVENTLQQQSARADVTVMRGEGSVSFFPPLWLSLPFSRCNVAAHSLSCPEPAMERRSQLAQALSDVSFSHCLARHRAAFACSLRLPSCRTPPHRNCTACTVDILVCT